MTMRRVVLALDVVLVALGTLWAFDVLPLWTLVVALIGTLGLNYLSRLDEAREEQSSRPNYPLM